MHYNLRTVRLLHEFSFNRAPKLKPNSWSFTQLCIFYCYRLPQCIKYRYKALWDYIMIIIIIISGVNRCPSQLLRSFERHEEKKNKIGRERSSMQHADYQCHWPTRSMNARKFVHAQKPHPSQAFAHESSKVGGRGKREEETQKRQRPGG